MDVVIRKLTLADLPRLVEMCGSHAEYEKATYDGTGKQEALQALIFADTPMLFCQVVESDHCLVGYFSYTFDVSTWNAGKFLYLDCLYLEPSHRGLKIGDRIFDLLRDIARQNSCVNIQWQTPAFNEKAIRFYNRIGATGKDKVRFYMSTL
jgi:GNAT superfamily N-acetyltransferase